ncbi:MAG TPA: hypothetical protein VME67_14660 [Mycobacterium sp.]|nr:hypothetical protein [Mycobacterium sp.]HTX95984.1 hypothetical protein [Mycobacterium sp.]
MRPERAVFTGEHGLARDPPAARADLRIAAADTGADKDRLAGEVEKLRG